MRRHSSRSASVRARLLLIALLLSCLLACVAAAQGSPQWVTINLDISSQRYVDLDRITPKNVGQLEELCSLKLKAVNWFSSGLLMVGGRIYVNTLASTFAMDATSCALLWQYDIPLTPWVATISNRGSAYLDNRIFRGTADGRVIALDAATGDLLWQTQAADPTRHEAFTSAPIAWNGKVFLGIVTADLGVRGRLMAFDTVTGKELWRFHTIPIGIEKNAGTWPSPLNGGATPAGGAFWTSYSLDPATGELFGPVSNPFPDYVQRTPEQTNLYTNSVISLDAATGNLNWYCQTISGDGHDWDLGTQPTLYRTKSGKDMLAIAGKEGYVYGLERTVDGSGQCQKKLAFRTAGTTVPPLNAPEPPLDATLRRVCPGTLGGAEWNGTAYHPELGLLYSGMVDFCFYYSAANHTDDPGFWESVDKGTVRADFSKLPTGWITAMDGESGKPVWSYPTAGPVLAGLVPTKSGLLFGGDVLGNLLALDAKTGDLLTTIKTGGALNHGLISYAVGDRQYVAAAVGGTSLNTAGVSGPLKVVLYGLPESGDTPARPKKAAKSGSIGQSPPSGARAKGGAGKPAVIAGVYAEHPTAQTKIVEGGMLFGAICGTCHGMQAQGSAYPSLLRHTELANGTGGFQVLKDFLSSVPPPMPILYTGKPDTPDQPDAAGLLNDAEVELIGAYVQYLVSVKNPQASNSAPPGYVYTPPSSEGSPDWQKVYKVLTSPRCINCHTVTNYPRQGDIRYPHIYSVVRGADNQGALVARCTHCHGTKNDEIRKGIPGAKDWQLAPVGLAWESAPGIPMTGPELCSMMQNQVLNGDIGLKELVAHLDTALVQWAWDPGTRWNGVKRNPPPGTHSDFVEAFTRWVNSGEGCPAPDPRSSSSAALPPPPDLAPGRTLLGQYGRTSSPR